MPLKNKKPCICNNPEYAKWTIVRTVFGGTCAFCQGKKEVEYIIHPDIVNGFVDVDELDIRMETDEIDINIYCPCGEEFRLYDTNTTACVCGRVYRVVFRVEANLDYVGKQDELIRMEEE